MNNEIKMTIHNNTVRMKMNNSIAIYTLGKMQQNYISAMQIPYNLLLDEKEKRRQRRLKDLNSAINEATKEIDLLIAKNPGAEDDISEYIGIYHVTCDEVFGLEEAELKRVNKLIEKIKKERQPRA
jgi:hypothetical protein